MVEDEIDENPPLKVSILDSFKRFLKDYWVVILFVSMVVAGCTTTITRTETEQRQFEIDRNIVSNILSKYIRG